MAKAKALYRTRKDQIEDEILNRLVRDLAESNGVGLCGEERDLIKDALKIAAMIGAAEERQRTERLLLEYDTSVLIGDAVRRMVGNIEKQSVFAVLGYDEPGAELKAKRKGGK